MTGHTNNRGGSAATLWGLTLTALLLVLAAWSATAAAAATPAPGWRITSVAAPTYFDPAGGGDSFYEIMIANKGGAATDGSPITIIDTLPEGLTVDHVELPRGEGTNVTDYGPSLCTVEKPADSEVVRCTIPSVLAGISEPTVLYPDEAIRLIVHVTVPASVSGQTLSNAAQVEGGGAPTASIGSQNKASSEPVPAGFSEYRSEVTGAHGLPATHAGSHPYAYTTNFAVNTTGQLIGEREVLAPAGGDLKDVRVVLPTGFVGDPTSTPRCSQRQFNTIDTIANPDNTFYTRNECPDGSAVGMIILRQLEGHGAILPLPIYNLVPPKGMPAQLAFHVLKAPFYIDTELVRDGGDYRIVAAVRNTSEVERVTAASVTIWGVPGDLSHDRLRGSCLADQTDRRMSRGSCGAGVPVKPFLRLPTSCQSPLVSQMSFNTWPNPGAFIDTTSTEPPPVGCESLSFTPTISAQPQTTVADSPSGLRFNLHVPQNDDPEALAEADLREAVVTLPEGVAVNPASANGLAGCSPAQIDLDGPGSAQCPDASKVGTVQIDTPLLDHPIGGGVFVATQSQNPFNSLLAIYIAVDDPASGVVIKLAGHVEPDPVTGRLTTTFADTPQLPFEDFTVEFFDGPRAPLRTPSTCGTFATTTSLTPWSAPASGPAATPSDSFAVTTANGGGPCAPTEAALPHSPSFSAGSLAPVAGAFSPFVTQLSRGDGSQNLRGLNVELPEGLLGKLAGLTYCPESTLAAVAARPGVDELAAPACPQSSRVGSVTIAAGAGPDPVHVSGSAYLAGPYRGAPISLAVVTPAVAGPFDLGTVVVRVALRPDPRTTQIKIDSDPFPTILQGIPLDVRSIHVNVDRPDFTVNPTDCDAKSVAAEALSVTGSVARLSDRFQVGGCRNLGFAPRLSLRLLGPTRRSTNPSLQAVLRTHPGDANISRTVVALPHSVFLDQGHIRTVCTRVQFAADQCPAGSVYGYARAITPLLDQPLEGPVYLRSSDNPLPDLVAALHGQIDVDLSGRIDSVHGGIRTSFDFVPDAPVTRFELRMKGGKKGLLVNSTDICKGRRRATVKMDGQNGKVQDFRPVLRNQCHHHPKKKKKRR
jgi:hypothetical protein